MDDRTDDLQEEEQDYSEYAELQEPQPEPKQERLHFLLPYRKYLIGAGTGAVLAGLIMWLGFWRVFFVTAMAAVGAFLLGTENKMEFLRKIMNRIIPNRRL